MQDMNETLDLNLDQKEIKVVLHKPETEEPLSCVLRELSGLERDRYLNKLKSRVNTNNEGKATGVKNFEGLQSDLLRRSLFYQTDEGAFNGKFEEKELQEFPSSVLSLLFDKARALSGLDEDAEKDEKKD